MSIDTDGWTLLIQCSYRGQIAQVIQLLEQGSDPNHRDSSGFTSLIYASRHQYVDIVRILLDHEADPNIRCSYGYTALSEAIYHKNEGIISLLLNKGADIYMTTELGDTPIQLCKDTRMRNILLSHPQSLFQKKDRSKVYMSLSYSDIDICQNENSLLLH